MKNINKLFAGAAITGMLAAGCDSAPDRPTVYPHAGIVLEKKTDSYIKCFNNSDFENVSGQCDTLQSSRRWTYHVTVGACSIKDSVVVLATDEYLKAAANNAVAYPVTGEGLAQQQPGMDPNKDYACAQTFEIKSQDIFDKIPEKSYYTE